MMISTRRHRRKRSNKEDVGDVVKLQATTVDNRLNIKTEWRQEAKELDEQLTKGKMS